MYVDFLVTIEEEAGFFNFETNEISLPRLGFQTKLEAELEELSYILADFGRIYWKVEKEVNSGFKITRNDFKAKLYTDKTRMVKTKLLHPDVLVVNLSENKELALQLTSSKIILGKSCNATQGPSIFSCPVLTQKEDLEWD